MNNDLEKIRHYQGTIADFKNFFDQKASETMGKPENTNAYDTPEYQGFNNVHPTRGPKTSPHWNIDEAITRVKIGDLVAHDKTGERYKVIAVPSKTKIIGKNRKGEERVLSTNHVTMIEVEMNEANGTSFDIFGYKTKDFDICPGAESLYKRIVDEEELPITKSKMTDSEKEMVRQSAELQDLLYAREKRALKIGAGKRDVEAAEDLAKKIMSLAKKMGLEKEHGYIKGHVDKIKSKMITEGIDREVGHTDDEPNMIADDLRIIERYARELRELVEAEGMKGESDFPHWWQSKIVKAKDYVIAAKHYLRNEVESQESSQIPTFESFTVKSKKPISEIEEADRFAGSDSKTGSTIQGRGFDWKKPPTDETIKLHINAYSVADDPYDVAVSIGKKYRWNQREIEKAEKIIRKKYIK